MSRIGLGAIDRCLSDKIIVVFGIGYLHFLVIWISVYCFVYINKVDAAIIVIAEAIEAEGFLPCYIFFTKVLGAGFQTVFASHSCASTISDSSLRVA